MSNNQLASPCTASGKVQRLVRLLLLTASGDAPYARVVAGVQTLIDALRNEDGWDILRPVRATHVLPDEARGVLLATYSSNGSVADTGVFEVLETAQPDVRVYPLGDVHPL